MTQLQGEGAILPARACPLDLSTAVREAARLSTWTACLRRERDAIAVRLGDRTASDGDLRRYRTIRLTLSLYDSPARRPHLPRRAVDAILDERDRLLMELSVGAEVTGPQVAS